MPHLSRRHFAQASLGALLVGCAPRSTPDLIIHGGPIYTGIADAPVEAVRISNGLFAVVGSLADARATSRNAREINLAGAAAYPGFTDAHVHLSGVGAAALTLDLVGVSSITDLQSRLRVYAAEHAEGRSMVAVGSKRTGLSGASQPAQILMRSSPIAPSSSSASTAMPLSRTLRRFSLARSAQARRAQPAAALNAMRQAPRPAC